MIFPEPPDYSLPEPVSDEDIEKLVCSYGAKWNGDHWVIEDADLHPMVRWLLHHATLAAIRALKEQS